MIKTKNVRGVEIVRKTKWDHNWIYDPLTNRIDELLKRDFGFFRCNGSLISKRFRHKTMQLDPSLDYSGPAIPGSLMDSGRNESFVKKRVFIRKPGYFQGINIALALDALERYNPTPNLLFQGADMIKVSTFLESRKRVTR